jgi:hypothetical protein
VRLNSNLREKTWRAKVARHKRSKSSSVEKESAALRREASQPDQNAAQR